RRGEGGRGRRRVHSDRPSAPVGARGRPGRDRRGRLRDHRGQVHAHERAGRVRGRRSGGPHLPPGGHRGGDRLSGRARRRVVPARHAAGGDRGGPLGQGQVSLTGFDRIHTPPPSRTSTR